MGTYRLSHFPRVKLQNTNSGISFFLLAYSLHIFSPHRIKYPGLNPTSVTLGRGKGLERSAGVGDDETAGTSRSWIRRMMAHTREAVDSGSEQSKTLTRDRLPPFVILEKATDTVGGRHFNEVIVTMPVTQTELSLLGPPALRPLKGPDATDQILQPRGFLVPAEASDRRFGLSIVPALQTHVHQIAS